jgi:hypothetical protein
MPLRPFEGRGDDIRERALGRHAVVFIPIDEHCGERSVS